MGMAACLLSACAGPMTPFGALNTVHRLPEAEAEGDSLGKSDVKIEFSPRRQVLHGQSPITIVIQDKKGVPENFLLRVSYNGIDVTSQFMRKVEKKYLDPQKKRLQLTSRNLRLLAQKENRLKVTYARNRSMWPVTTQYLSPRCSAFEKKSKLATIPDFEVDAELIDHIDHYAKERRFNPYYVAGLIAQESAFDPKAVSRSRAVGLTQVTPLGDAELARIFDNWPRYPGIGEMSWMQLKFGIANGRINATNEWRLNPEYSVRGGVEYLRYLTEYWLQPERQNFVKKYAGSSETALSEIILASYNSGASRVANALQDNGRRWLQDNELGEARRYVRRVVSYCDHFSRGGK